MGRYGSGIKDWKKFEINNNEIALNILFIPYNTKKINLANKSKYNHKRKNQVVLLMTTNDKKCDEVNKWHYIALKSIGTADRFNCPIRSLSRLFRGITSNNSGDFYCLGCFYSFQTDAEKSLKVPFTIYTDLECLLIQQQSCQNNANEFYTERKAIHERSGYH